MVMGWIWTGMALLALGAAVLTGQTGALTAAALEGAASAIRLALGLAVGVHNLNHLFSVLSGFQFTVPALVLPAPYDQAKIQSPLCAF